MGPGLLTTMTTMMRYVLVLALASLVVARFASCARDQPAFVRPTAFRQGDDDSTFRYALSSDLSPKWLLQECFTSAKRNISAAIYKFGDEDLYKTLLQTMRARPQLALRLVVNEETMDSKSKDWLRELQKTGNDVQVMYWHRDGDDTYEKLHAKFTICDSMSILGSANWSENSCEGNNMEFTFSSQSPEIAQEMYGVMDRLWSNHHASPA